MSKQTRSFFISSVLLLGGSFQVHGQTIDRHAPFRTPNKRYELRSIVWELRTIKEVSSIAPGWSPPGEFFLLSEDLLHYGNEEDFKKLLKDVNPVVRVMGLVCLAQTDFEKYAPTLRTFLIDKAEIDLAHHCTIGRTTVSEIAERLLKDPNFLGHRSAQSSTGKAVQN